MVFEFTVDKVLNNYVHPSIVPRLPQPLKRLLGGNNPKPIAAYWLWLDILVGSFCGIALLEGLFKSSNIFTDHHNAPLIIASYGATAILCFNTIGAPLAQPRNILFGHFFSALIGVCLSKLFSLSHAGQDNYWAAGALSVGLASVAMTILNCVHPPAGASALLPCVDEGIRKMSWWYLPTHIVSSVLIICVSLITDNVLRKYPSYWWAPVTIEKKKKADLEEKLCPQDQEERQLETLTNTSHISSPYGSSEKSNTEKSNPNLVSIVDELNRKSKKQLFKPTSVSRTVEINHQQIVLPAHTQLSHDDLIAMQRIHHKLFSGPPV